MQSIAQRVTMSQYPIFGLKHKINVIRKSDSDDGAGGVIPGGSSKYIYTKVAARITTMKGDDEQRMFGNASGQRWRLLIQHTPNIQRSDFIEVNDKSIKAPIDKDTEYRVLWVKHQIDEHGNFHHTSCVVELEDADG